MMHFRRQSDTLLTLQERCSKLTLAERLASQDANDTNICHHRSTAALPSNTVQTITHDNGGEFTRHKRFKDAIGIRAFFCDPHSPWQRGAIENASAARVGDSGRMDKLKPWHYWQTEIGL